MSEVLKIISTGKFYNDKFFGDPPKIFHYHRSLRPLEAALQARVRPGTPALILKLRQGELPKAFLAKFACLHSSWMIFDGIEEVDEDEGKRKLGIFGKASSEGEGGTFLYRV